MDTRAIHDALAGIVAYPAEGYGERLEQGLRVVSDAPEAAREPLRRFEARCRDLSLEDLQEAYTRSFDMSQDCSMEIGWHLHGENYARGEFLVEMRRALRRHGLAESTELPDHLVHVLPILGRAAPDEREQLVARCLPALDKVLAGLQGQDSPFEDLLRSVRAFVGGDGGKEGRP